MRTSRHSSRRAEKKKWKKQQIFTLSGAILLIVLLTVGFFTYRNYPNERSVDDAYFSDHQEFTVIDIPQTKSLLFDSQNNTLNQVDTGKVYYQGISGKLQSRIKRNKNEVYEELISYDNNGNAVDGLEIGYICNSPKHLKCAVIFKNKISIYETIPTGSKDNAEIVTEYLISPKMKFILGKTYTKL